MSIPNRVVSTFTNLFRPRKLEDGTWFYAMEAGTWKEVKNMLAFSEIPEVNAVINYSARTFSSGVLKIQNDKGEDQPNHPLAAILNKPNFMQEQKEFLRQTKLYHDIFGNEYLSMLVPVGMPDRVKAMFTLPPSIVTPTYESSTPYYLQDEASGSKSIKYEIETGNNKRSPLDPNTIVHLNDNKVKVESNTDKNILKGVSKLQGLTPAINNIRMAYESRGVILKNRGALGILSNATADAAGAGVFDPKEKSYIQEAYKQYGGLSNQMQLIITSANLKWQQMSVNPDKLGLFQEIEDDWYKVLDAYGALPELFARGKGSTYENQKQARKGYYIDTTIPAGNEWAGALSRKWFPDGRFRVVIDYMHLAIFQEDLKSKAEALTSMANLLSKLFTDGVISIEEYTEEMRKLLKLGKR